MFEQFERVAADLGWDVERQIEVLEDFTIGFGVGSRLEDYLRRQGLGASRRPPLVRDALLTFIDGLPGSRGAFSHYLQRKLRQAALAAKTVPSTSQPPAPPAIPMPRAGRWMPVWLQSRRRPAAP